MALSRRAALLLAALVCACGRGEGPGPVRTPMKAAEAAQRTLRSAGLDESVVDVRRQDGDWVVITRWKETSLAGHLVTVDAATGRTKVERYRSVEIGGPPKS